MPGAATTCKRNAASGRQGCGAAYSGRMLHCVAPAPWSAHPDGLCHETFGGERGCNRHLGVDRHGNLWHVDPRAVENLRRDDRGIWHTPPPRMATVTAGNAESGPLGAWSLPSGPPRRLGGLLGPSGGKRPLTEHPSVSYRL